MGIGRDSVLLDLLWSIIFLEINLFLFFPVVKALKVMWDSLLIMRTCSKSHVEISYKHELLSVSNYISQTNRNCIHHKYTYSVSVLTYVLFENISQKEIPLNLSESINLSFVSLPNYRLRFSYKT